jgi:PAS domain S-box-containing protein
MVVTGTYNPYLVALSILVAAFASYTALDLAGRVAATRAVAPREWLVAAAIAMGGGIWSMHFIAMLAFNMPVLMSYDIGLTTLSLVVAIFVTGAGFYFISRQSAPPLSLVFSGIFMGLGIAVMHYIGMAAMREHAEISYDFLFVLLSLVIAIGASTAALWLAFRTTDLGQKIVAAVVMGLAISGMHYSAMRGTTFAVRGSLHEAQGYANLDQTNLALVVAGITFIILAFALIASLQQENSERRRAEEALRRSEAYLAEAQTLSHTGSFGWNTSNGEIYWSEETFRIFEFDRSIRPTVDLLMRERVHPEDVAVFRRVVVPASQHGQDFSHEFRLRLPDGGVKHIHVVAQAINNQAEGVEFVGAVMDITAAKKAEEKSRNDEKELRVTIDTLPAFVLRAQPNGAVDFVSQSVLDYSGLPREQWLGSGWMQCVHPKDLERTMSQWCEALSTEKPFDLEMRMRSASGQYRWFQCRGLPLRHETGSILKWYSTMHDVEDRKRTEEKLQKSEANLAEAQKLTKTGSWAHNMRSGAFAASPELLRIFGLNPDAEISRETLRGRLHPEDQHVFDDVITLKTGYEFDYRIILADGSIRHAHTVGHPIFDATGSLVERFGTVVDVTERKRAEAEKERLEVQLRQSQKMEAMGTLAGGIAHDFNNILGAILGYGELAQQAAAEGSEVRRFVDNVMHAGERAKSLVDRILAFSRSGVSELSPINVQAVIDETLELLAAASLSPGIRLEKRLDAGGAAIVGDATQLHQVAMNLCTNALQAMESGGVLAVALDRKDIAQELRLSNGTLPSGAYVCLCVSDTGSGISPPVLERMFDPFFTTKSAGKGTGLGLSLVHGIVADLGGRIDVSTAIGCGTTFTIWLPCTGEAAAPSTGLTTRLPHGCGQTILIVDNEKALVALAEETLAELGYEPIGFSSSVDALQAFREAPQRFDVVLTDESMPELTGTDLAREVALLRPDMPIVLMSGFGGAQLHERAQAIGIRELLRKPLQRKDLAECFGRVLPN